MTSSLVRRALERADIAQVLDARLRGDLALVRASRAKLEAADLLPLGALADAVRAGEIGAGIRLHLRAPGAAVQILHPESEGAAGVAFLRQVAIARIVSEPAQRIAVDWVEIGLELAQVALGFGASELAGVVTNKRGLPIADGETRKIKGQGNVALQAIKLRELEGLLARVGRIVTYEGEGAADTSSIRDTTSMKESPDAAHVR